VYFRSEADWFNTAADAWCRIKRLPRGMGLFTIEKVIGYRDVGPSPGPCPDLMKQLLEEIPLPYSLTAIAWYEGEDVRHEPVSNSLPLSRSTYYRHRRKLPDYGIDIGRKCNLQCNSVSPGSDTPTMMPSFS
jgi:Phage X family